MSKMEKIQNWFEEKLAPVFDKVSEQRHLLAISHGVTSIIPLTIIGGISQIIANPPISAEQVGETGNVFLKFLLAWYHFAQTNMDTIMMPYYASMALMALFACSNIAMDLARSYKMDEKGAMLNSLVVLLMVTATSKMAVLVDSITTVESVGELAGMMIPTNFLDANGLFNAMIIGLTTVEISRLVMQKGWYIKLPSSVPPAVTDSFASLFPLIFNVGIYMVIHLLCVNILGITLPECVGALLSPALEAKNSLFIWWCIFCLPMIPWFFGIKGDAFVGPLWSVLAYSNLSANQMARAAGQIATAFPTDASDFMICLGGSGATLALCIFCLMSKSKRIKTVGRISIVPGICGINEPLIFGLPIMLNFFLLVPFISAQSINLILGWFATKWGIIGGNFTSVPWTTPAPLGAFLAAMDWRNFVWVLALLVVDGVIYYPFFKIYEKKCLAEEAGN